MGSIQTTHCRTDWRHAADFFGVSVRLISRMGNLLYATHPPTHSSPKWQNGVPAKGRAGQNSKLLTVVRKYNNCDNNNTYVYIVANEQLTILFHSVGLVQQVSHAGTYRTNVQNTFR
jgi:hypothetical protein